MIIMSHLVEYKDFRTNANSLHTKQHPGLGRLGAVFTIREVGTTPLHPITEKRFRCRNRESETTIYSAI